MSDFKLPNEKIVIKYIPRRKGVASNVNDDHVVSGGMLKTATRKFTVPLQRNNTVKNVLTEEEKILLEKMTQLNLSVYGDFWSDFRVILHKEDALNILDLSNPIDYISYKTLLSLTKSVIAPSWTSRNKNLEYEFAITRENEDLVEDKKRFDAKKEAFKTYGKIETDYELLKGVLRLLSNKPISKDIKIDFLQSKIEDYIDSTPKAFLEIVKDTSLHTKVMIHKAIELGLIIKNNTKYSTEDGLDLCEVGEVPTFDRAVLFLDNPRNQDIRSLIEAKVNKKK